MRRRHGEAESLNLRKKILIVDDNEDSRELVIKVLQRCGYRLVEAVDGEEALEKAVAEKPDLILMDRSLPKLDGLEVVKRLQEDVATRQIPIVALTAHAMRGDREKALAAGCADYIPKPINVRTLAEQVKLHLDKSSGGSSNAADE